MLKRSGGDDFLAGWLTHRVDGLAGELQRLAAAAGEGFQRPPLLDLDGATMPARVPAPSAPMTLSPLPLVS